MNANKHDTQKNNSTQHERCRTCGAPVSPDDRTYPFCCERCRMGDLGKWFAEDYTISRPIEQRDLEEGD